MAAERWTEFQSIIGELAAVGQEEQSTRLALLASTDPELFEQLARLLTADASAGRQGRLHGLALPPQLAVVGAPAPERPPRAFPAWPAPDAGLAAAAAASVADDPLGLAGRRVSHFRVKQLLGRGGVGVVYSAEDVRLGRTVALKFLLPEYSLDAGARQRFLQETRAASVLDHPHICTIYEAGGTEQGLAFLAMRYYEGETLRARLHRCGALPIEEAVEHMRQMSSGVAAAHAAGIVHRDLKPGNLMLTPGGMLKILDFGIAKLLDVSLTSPDQLPATVAYCSPEQLQRDEVDGRSDLWSLGVVLYEMLTGRAPFGRGHELSTVYRILHEPPAVPSSLRPQVPARLESIVLRLLDKEPAARYVSATDVLRELARAACVLPLEASVPRSAPGRIEADERRSHNLPAQPTSLIGREKEIGELRERLQRRDLRLLTLTGPAGTGKTRLALYEQALAPHRD